MVKHLGRPSKKQKKPKKRWSHTDLQKWPWKMAFHGLKVMVRCRFRCHKYYLLLSFVCWCNTRWCLGCHCWHNMIQLWMVRGSHDLQVWTLTWVCRLGQTIRLLDSRFYSSMDSTRWHLTLDIFLNFWPEISSTSSTKDFLNRCVAFQLNICFLFSSI